jgi:hypothetical protein
LGSFPFGEVYEVLHSLKKFGFSNLSGSIVFAQDLKWTITICRQIIATICLPISSGYSEWSRKIVGKTNSIHSIVSTGTGIGSIYFLTKSTTIGSEKILFGGF